MGPVALTRLLSSEYVSFASVQILMVSSREAVTSPNGQLITPLTYTKDDLLGSSIGCAVLITIKIAALTSSSCPRSSARRCNSSQFCMLLIQPKCQLQLAQRSRPTSKLQPIVDLLAETCYTAQADAETDLMCKLSELVPPSTQ